MREFRVHEAVAVPAPVRWRRGPVAGPFHGAWAEDEAQVVEVLGRVFGDLRIVPGGGGWFVLLLGGQVDEAPTPWPLKRSGNLFHAADLEAVPREPESAVARIGWVEGGRIRWREWTEAEAVAPSEFFARRAPVREVEVAAAAPVEGWPAAFPTFLAEELPRVASFEQEEKRRLEEVPDPGRSLLSKLFGTAPPPPPDWNRKGLLRRFWDWVDSKPAAAPAGSGPGFLRRLLDRQSAMFDRLARLFERGDLDVALKHSVPLGADPGVPDGTLSTASKLSENPVDFSLERLGKAGRGGVAVGAPGTWERLRDLYRRAAEELTRQGRHRQAAYVYAHLLRDFDRAAVALEAAGSHLEAATLVKERLRDPRRAAQILERGGRIPEAVELYLADGRFEEAVGVCGRAGMEAEARRCLELWLKDLAERGMRIAAGDLLRDRMGRPAEAKGFYREELAAPGGQRGEAGARLVALEFASSGRVGEEWEYCESRLRGRAAAKELAAFHRGVRAWAAGRTLPAEAERFLLRRTRASLVGGLRESRSGVRELAPLLSELLESGPDPLAAQDLRRGLDELQAPAGPRPGRRRVAAGIRPLPGGGWLCWVDRRWARADGSAQKRSAPQSFESLPRALAVGPLADPLGAAIVGIVTHDYRFTIGRLDDSGLELLAPAAAADALSVAPGEGGVFLIGTRGGGLVVGGLEDGRVRLTARAEGEAGPLAILERWATLFLVGAGEGPDLDFFVATDDDTRHLAKVESPVGAVELLDVRGTLGLAYGRSFAFGLLRPESEGVECVRVEGLPAGGVTALGFCGEREVAVGYADGRIALAELDLDAVALRGRGLFRTSLGSVVALRGVDKGRVLALDADFGCALVDARSLSLVYQGAWPRA